MTFYNRIEHPVYFNDFDEGACAWIAELMKQGHIPPGEIDSRSILEVQPDDVKGFTQCHFFSGIAGWAYALRLAGVPVDLSLWTGSPPCQPFSVAGRQEGREDERHLAPHFVDLVRVARPGLLLGEQVASAEVFGKAPKRARGNAVPPPDWAWIDDLLNRLEAARYTAGAVDFPSAGVGAPHIRQRTYFGAVAHEWLEHASPNGRIEWGTESSEWGAGIGRGSGGLADLHGDRRIEAGRSQPEAGCNGSFGDRAIGGLEDTNLSENQRFGQYGGEGVFVQEAMRSSRRSMVDGFSSDRGDTRLLYRKGTDNQSRPGPTNGFWGTADWLFCRDERWRPVEPGTFPLASRVSGRVGLLRGYGNAINPQQAAIFIKAFFEALQITSEGGSTSDDGSTDGLIV